MIKTKTNRPVRRIEYWLVVVSVCIVGVCYYGIRAAAVYGLAAVTAVLTDFFCLFLRGRSYRLVDLSNIANALILAMMLPATIPYSILMLSTFFAVAVGTHVFGYRRDYVFPPAAAGYLFALLSWPKSVLLFPETGEHLTLFHNDAALYESLSAVINREETVRTDLFDLLLGIVCTPMGTGCLLLLGVGMLVLLLRRQLNPWALFGCFFGICISSFFVKMTVFEMLAANMIVFSMLFMVADPVLMPCRSYMAYIGAALTGLFTGCLIGAYDIEYAPVIAVMLSSPLWRALAALEINFLSKAEEKQEAENEGA